MDQLNTTEFTEPGLNILPNGTIVVVSGDGFSTIVQMNSDELRRCAIAMAGIADALEGKIPSRESALAVIAPEGSA